MLARQLRGFLCFPVDSNTKVKNRHRRSNSLLLSGRWSGLRKRTPTISITKKKPVLIIEVLSDSTRRIDQGEKKDAYLQIPTLEAFLLIETEKAEVTVYERKENQFIATLFNELNDIIALSTLALSLPLAELYERVNFFRVGATAKQSTKAGSLLKALPLTPFIRVHRCYRRPTQCRQISSLQPLGGSSHCDCS